MRMEIFREQEKVEVEQVITVRLVKCEGGVKVQVCNERGERCNRGDLIEISPKGVRCFRHINEDLGFNLDSGGKLLVI